MSKGISPEIYFKGYTDTWKQRRLLDCIQKITDFRGRTPKKLGLDWSDGGYLALSALNVKDGYIDFSQDVHYGNQELYDKWMTGNELHKGQVLFTTEAPMGNVAQVPDDRHYILSQRTIAFDVKSEIITEDFLATVLRTPTVFSALTALSSGGTAKGVSQKSLASANIIIPRDLKEQEHLSSMFLQIDNLITLHQRKYTKLKNYKSAIANKIFPAIGQQPVLRIIDKEPWKEVPFSEIGDYFSADSLGYADLIEDGKYKCLLYGDLYTKYNEKVINVKSSTDKLVTKLFKGDILFPTSTTVDALSLIAPSSVCEDDVYAGGDLFGIRPKVDINGTFVSYYINNKHSLKNSLSKNAQGLTIVHIHYDNIKDEKIMLPEYDEQIAIVSLFTALDNLIESENNYINKLKIIKQAFLSKMFVEVEA